MPDTHPVEARVFPVRPEFAAQAHVTADDYRATYDRAARDPDGFWAEEAKRIAWIKPPTQIKNTSSRAMSRSSGSRTACSTPGFLRRPSPLANGGDQRPSSGKATIPAVSSHVTYRELHDRVCRLANAMKSLGVQAAATW